MENEIEMRKLTIKTFHIQKVEFDKKTFIQDKVLYLRENLKMDLIQEAVDIIKSIDIKIVNPEEHDFFVNSIMDFSPIATKVLGKIGDGITHTLTGVYVMLTGIDEMGIQVAEFGSSEGILSAASSVWSCRYSECNRYNNSYRCNAQRWYGCCKDRTYSST